jgi:hypothetical protein
LLEFYIERGIWYDQKISKEIDNKILKRSLIYILAKLIIVKCFKIILDLLNQLINRLKKLNDGSFEIEDRETERVKKYNK